MRWLVGFALAIVAAYLAWIAAYPVYIHRYKLTFTFEVDGKQHSASTVLENTYRTGPKLGSAPLGSVSLTGEAIFVDLDAAGHIIVILAHNVENNPVYTGGFANLALQAYEVMSCNGLDCAHKAIAHASGVRELPWELIPILVYFDDLRDPSTLKLVQRNSLRSSLGAPMTIQKATVELTRDAITWQIHRHLPWTGDEGSERKANAALEHQSNTARGRLGSRSVIRRN